jgi:hypothetical protein
MPNYLKIQARAAKSFAKSGREVILRQFSSSGGAYNPSLGKVTAGAYIETVRYAITEDQPGSQIAERFGLTREKATLVSNKNKWVYMDANGPQPQIQDRIIFDNVSYIVRSSQGCAPAGIAVLYLVVLES